jgi:hypothetical protein
MGGAVGKPLVVGQADLLGHQGVPAIRLAPVRTDGRRAVPSPKNWARRDRNASEEIQNAAASVPGNWDQTLDHLSAIDRRDTAADGHKVVTLARRRHRHRRSPPPSTACLRSGHGVICTCLIPGEPGFGKEACLVAALTASGAGGSRTSTLATYLAEPHRKNRAGCRRSKVSSQVWSQARGAQCAHGEANKTRATDHGLAKPGQPPGPVATTPALRRPSRCRARARRCQPTPTR